MKQLLLFLACLQLTICQGQVNEFKQAETDSNDYMKIVYGICSNPDIIDVETTIDGYLEVEFLCDGKRHEIGIRNNTLLFHEHSVNQEEIPLDVIKRKLEKDYYGWSLDEISQVHANDTSFLKLEVIKDGIEQNLYFTNDGKWFKIKAIDISSDFDFNAIKNNQIYKSAKYEFHLPDRVYDLPDLLREVSGIALSNENIVYCVQDEIGSIFEYDLSKQIISNSFRFTDKGDFEGLTINKDIAYVLRSDGNLFIYDFNNQSKISQIMLQTNSLNIEGVCFKDGYIYIASKEALINHPDSKRVVYRAKESSLSNIEPYLEIDIDDLSYFLKENYPESGIEKIIFNPSSIAIHPITNEMYILSASDRFIAIFNDKRLVNVIPLPPEVYYKPEGLSFYENGDLLISSEGDKKGFVPGTINLLRYK